MVVTRALAAVGWLGGGMVLVGGRRMSGRSVRDDPIDSDVSFAAILTCQMCGLQVTCLEVGLLAYFRVDLGFSSISVAGGHQIFDCT